MIDMSRLTEYFLTDEFGLTKESLIKCNICGRCICEETFESEPGWQRLGDMDYCPGCLNNTERKL